MRLRSTDLKYSSEPCEFGSAQLGFLQPPTAQPAPNLHAAPTDRLHVKPISRNNGFLKGPRQACQSYPRSGPYRYAKIRPPFRSQGSSLTLVEKRFAWWCHPGPRRVYGRPDPFHHPQRQGPRYGQRFQAGMRDQKLTVGQSVRTTSSACSSLSARPGG